MSASEILRSSVEKMACPISAAYDQLGFEYDPSGPSAAGSVSARLSGARLRAIDDSTSAVAAAIAAFEVVVGPPRWYANEVAVEGPGLDRCWRGGGSEYECCDDAGDDEGRPWYAKSGADAGCVAEGG